MYKLFINRGIYGVLIVLITAGLSFSQNRYNFDFQEKWEWVDLMIDNQCSLFGVIEQLKFLRDEYDINTGRLLFRELAKLDSLNQLNDFSKVIENDISVNRDYFRKQFSLFTGNINLADNFGGIVKAAVILTELRNSFNEENKLFADRTYLIKPAEQIPTEMKLSFDFSNADYLLSILKNPLSESDFKSLYESENINNITGNFKNKVISKEEFINCIKEVNNNDPLNNIYIICNPLAYLTLGNVRNNIENYEKTVNEIKNVQQNIFMNCAYLLSQFFPPNIIITNKINLLFGSRIAGWRGSNNEIQLDLNRFGNNYDLFTKYLTRELFYDVKNATQLNTIDYLYSNEDTILIKLIEEVYDNGISNYLAPILQANRPQSLLEKDFALFKRTYKAIIEKKPTEIIDSLFCIGSKEMYFHSMGTQMAYSLDVYLGRNSIRNALMYGPLFFFKEYMEAYNLDDTKIRSVFRLPKDFEKKLESMNRSVSYDMMRDVINIKLNSSDTAAINPSVRNLFKKYKDRKDIWYLNLLTGKLYINKGFFSESLPYIINSYTGIISREKFSKDIGNLYFTNSAYKESVEMFNRCISYSAEKPDYFLKRGISYYNLGEYDKSKTDFEKVISLDPENNLAKDYLSK